MTTKNLYRITRPDGGSTITPNLPAGAQYEDAGYRIIADDGYHLVKGELDVVCLDVQTQEETEGWIELPIEEPEDGDAS